MQIDKRILYRHNGLLCMKKDAILDFHFGVNREESSKCEDCTISRFPGNHSVCFGYVVIAFPIGRGVIRRALYHPDGSFHTNFAERFLPFGETFHKDKDCEKTPPKEGTMQSRYWKDMAVATKGSK